MRPAAGFWRGKSVFVTGHTGFKGGWLALWLEQLGAVLHGFALAPATTPDLFTRARVAERMAHRVGDVRDPAALADALATAQPEIVFHLAAQSLVRAGYRQPLETFATNTMGTANLLEAVRAAGSVRCVVVVTTDKVYENLERPYPYRESDALGGHDPYSASKAAAELVAASYRSAFLQELGIGVASARAGNVIGGGDWSEDRLIPDAVRAWEADAPLLLRRPRAVRPWQHVLEPLAAYLRLAEQLWLDPALAGPFNFGPPTHEAAAVEDVIRLAREAYGRGEWKCAEQVQGPHEAHWLALEVAKARELLGVRPAWTLAQAVERTMHWYRALREGGDALALCRADIAAYEAQP